MDCANTSSPSTLGQIDNYDQITSRDLVIFEDRLRGNMIRLLKRKRKYEAFLASLLVLFVIFFYLVFINPSKVFTVHLIFTALLLLDSGSIVAFFGSGMYSEKIVFAAEFVSHCNRSLRAYNLHFIPKDKSGELRFYHNIPKSIQDGFAAYRKQYNARKRARLANQKSS